MAASSTDVMLVNRARPADDPLAWKAAVLGAALVLAPAAPAAGTTERVSVGPGGRQANGQSFGAAMTPDGRYVAFLSDASNLVPGDTNGLSDVFVHDRRTDRTERVNLGPVGAQAIGGVSSLADISPGGRYVLFSSDAGNLVPGDTNGVDDVFLRDRTAGRTVRVSLGVGNRQGNRASAEGAVSASGRFVAFTSEASNLVPGDTNRVADVFVRDLATGLTWRVSVGPSGRQANGGSDDPVISTDGRVVAFRSAASNLVPGDTNDAADIFVYDVPLGRTICVSVGPGGRQANEFSQFVELAPGGNYVGFGSIASNLVPGDTNGGMDVFVRDLLLGRTTRVSLATGGGQADGASFPDSVATSARFIAFSSGATNLVPGDTNGVDDVFVRVR